MASCFRFIFGSLIAATAWAQVTATPGAAPIVRPGAPGASSSTLSPASVAIKSGTPNPEDVKFMQGMIHHHSQAVEMTALMPSRTHNKALLEFGKRISISQTDEIEYMRTWLRERGQTIPMGHDMAHMDHSAGGMDMGSMPMMPGMLTADQMKALAAAKGATFDRLFLTGMIQHHNGALIMVDALFAAGAGQENQIFDFATDIDNTQSAEIEIMKGMLAKEKK